MSTSGGGPRPTRGMFVTNVEGDGPCVRIWAQEDSRTCAALEAMLAEAAGALEARGPPSPEELVAYPLVAARVRGRFYRARLSRPPRPPGSLAVRLVDFGNEEEVGPEELRSLVGPPLPPALAAAPPQAIDFLLGGVVHPSGRWDAPLLEHLRRIVYYKEATCAFRRACAGGRRLASVRVDGVDLAEYLVEQGIAAAMDPARRTAVPRPLASPSSASSAPSASAPARAFRSRALDRDSGPVAVTVVAAEEGPDLFAVRMLQDERAFAELTAAIAGLEAPVPLGPPADVGAVCLARFSEAEPPGRAVVAGGAAAAAGPALFFVDRGLAETVPWRNVYRIPDELVAPPAFAMRFRLSGGPVAPAASEKVRRAFAAIVRGKRATLKVAAPEGSPLVQRCELYVDGVDVRSLLEATAEVAGNREVRALVSFVASLAEFYVQPVDSLDALDATMARVAERCANSAPLTRAEVRPGAACCALYPEDLRWYRARVLAATEEGALVRYVDYGNEREVPLDRLRPTTAALLELEEQAIRCALDGFESGPFDVELSRRFEETTIDRELRATVKAALGNGSLLVDLIDDRPDPPASVADLLRGRSGPRPEAPPDRNRKVDADFQKSFEPSTRRENELRESEERRPAENRPLRNKSNNAQKRTGDAQRRAPVGGFSKHGHRPRDFGNDKFERSKGRREKNYDNYSNKPNNYNKPSPNDNRLLRARNMETENVPAYTKPAVNALKNPAPLDSKFKSFVPQMPYECDVKVSWFIDPFNFYVQSVPLLEKFEKMMSAIPQMYAEIRPIDGHIGDGSAVLAQYPPDKVLCRAKVIKTANYAQEEYLVYFVDFGNKCVVKKNKIWQLEKELLNLPMLAVNCAIDGISPVNGKWSDNYQEDSCFKEAQYKCNFHTLNEEMYSVSLECSGTGVNQLLISYNLAVDKNAPFIREKGEKVEADLIIGQCFYSKVFNVESMLKFFLCLDPPPEDGKNYKMDASTNINDFYSNQTIECSLYKFDPSKCKTKAEVFKKEQEYKYVISYIDNIIGNRLLVTLYDAKTGQRFNYFPDEESVEYVTTVCAHPIFNRDFGLAYTSHVESVNELYLQRSKNIDGLTLLLDNLYSFYASEDSIDNIIPESDKLCAAKSCDGNWYRAKIIKKFPADCQVQYIDYGNKETVSLKCLKVLDPQFFNIYEQCLLCSLEISPFDVDVEDLKKLIGDNEVNAELSLNDIGWVADLTLNKQNVVANLKTNKPEIDQDSSNLVSLYISHIDSPGQFWVQLSSDSEKLEELSTKLQKDAVTSDKLQDFEIGKLCIAKYSADEQYYRATILDSDSDITTVRFIDFGNTDVLDNVSDNLKKISKELAETPPLAIKCSVNASPTGTGEWSEQASEMFTQSIRGIKTPIMAKIILKDIITYVDLFVNNGNITNELVKAGFASSSIKQSNGKLPTCFASHINSPSEFWIQLENSVSDLEAVSEQLIDAENFPPISEIEEGVICAAKFPEDGCWYRAKIVIHGSNGTEVLFMDYGNASLTNELRSLPEKLKVLPALSRKCALQKPADIDMWSKDAEIKFSEIAADGETIFEINFIASGDLSIVELYFEKNSITEKLVAIQKELPSIKPFIDETIFSDCEEDYSIVHISHSHGPDNFWVQHVANSNQLNIINNILLDAEKFQSINDPPEGTICVALFLENNHWYRSKIIDKGDAGVEVVHIDYGTTAVSKELREMPFELESIAPLATNCCLYSKNLQFKESHHENFLEILSKPTQEFHMEIVNFNTNPILINLFIKDSGSFINILSLIGLDINRNSDSNTTLEIDNFNEKVDNKDFEIEIESNLTKNAEEKSTTNYDKEMHTSISESTTEMANICIHEEFKIERSGLMEDFGNVDYKIHEGSSDLNNSNSKTEIQISKTNGNIECHNDEVIIIRDAKETSMCEVGKLGEKDLGAGVETDDNKIDMSSEVEDFNFSEKISLQLEAIDVMTDTEKQDTSGQVENSRHTKDNLVKDVKFEKHTSNEIENSSHSGKHSTNNVKLDVEKLDTSIEFEISNHSTEHVENDLRMDTEKLDMSSNKNDDSLGSSTKILDKLSDTTALEHETSLEIQSEANDKFTESPKCDNIKNSSVINDFVGEENIVEKKLNDSIEKKDIQ